MAAKKKKAVKKTPRAKKAPAPKTPAKPRAKKVKKLRVLQVGPKRGKAPRAFSYESREPLADPEHKGAAESIQAASVARRFATHRVAQEIVAAGYTEVVKAGQYRLKLNRPLTKKDLYDILIETAQLFGVSREEAIEIVNRGSTRPSEALVFEYYTLVGNTSKMGCYSFNLPAGPMDLFGNCPAASPGFMFSTPEQRAGAQRGLVAALPIHVGNYICNGCVVGDTKVLVKDRGSVSVEVLESEAEEFEVWSGKAWRKARAVFTGHKPVFQLVTSWGASLWLTADHQVLTKDRGWVEAKDLVGGEPLVYEPPPEPNSLMEKPVEDPRFEKLVAYTHTGRSVPVYDLQVEVDHAFVANSVTIHNCYAIKGSYGNPNQTVHQQIKRILTEQWLRTPSASGQYSSLFVETMIRHIGKVLEKCANQRSRVSRDRWWQINHPNYFRIHDAGDFYSPEYTRAWFEIIRALPNVLFWAPTRMWAMAKLSTTVFAKGVPENLALRPSALHFGEMPPPVDNPATPQASVYGTRMPGLSAPSGAASVMPPGVWECPAMMHATEGGGAVPKLINEGPRKGQQMMDKFGRPVLKGGMCARAHGPNSPLRGGTDMEDTPDRGGGCRVCWRNRDLRVFYHEH